MNIDPKTQFSSISRFSRIWGLVFKGRKIRIYEVSEFFSSFPVFIYSPVNLALVKRTTWNKFVRMPF